MIGKKVKIKNKEYTVLKKERASFIMKDKAGDLFKITQKMFDRMGGQVIGDSELSREDRYPHIAQLISWSNIFAKGSDAWVFPSNENDARKFIDHLESSLSPENLTCDGELSGSQIAKKKADLMVLKRELEEVLGRQIDLNH